MPIRDWRCGCHGTLLLVRGEQSAGRVCLLLKLG